MHQKLILIGVNEARFLVAQSFSIIVADKFRREDDLADRADARIVFISQFL